MMSHAAQPIAARKALLVLLLFFAAQLFTLVVFFAASVAVFHIFAGGIFFYKCMVISLVWSIALFIGFLWFSNLRALRDLLMSAQVHPGWFAFFNAMTHFLSVMLFVMIVPGAIDRSQSVFLIGIMGEHPERTYTADELQQIFISTYVKDGDAIGRRMDEQLATGTIVRDGNGFRLTPQGLGTLKTMKLFAFIFNVDTRYVDPQTAHSRKPPQPAP